jgi:hypothetical protein
MSNTSDVIDGKPIAIRSESINPTVPFYDVHGRKRDVLFFYFVPDTTRDYSIVFIVLYNNLAYLGKRAI